MWPMKRLFLLGMAAAGLVGHVFAEQPVIRLWPIEQVGGVLNRLKEEVTNEGKTRYRNIKDPNLTVYPVHRPEPTPAVIYCPGGAYKHLTPRPEIIQWLNDSGVTVFMLKYTVSEDREAAFRDVQRAMRVVRHDAERWNIDPGQLGLLGSSAGGHLVARLSQNYETPAYRAFDEADKESCEPAFVVLASAAYFFKGKGEERELALAEEFPMKARVAPTFLVYAKDDRSHCAGGVAYEKALKAAGGSTRIVVSDTGGHGLNNVNWYPECRQWLKEVGIDTSEGSAAVQAGGKTKAMTPPEIWAGYDPRAAPLDEEVHRMWEEDGVTYREVYFNGEPFDGKYVRIYGIYAAPTGGANLPAMLHIHGGGQTANEQWLKELAGRGYAVLTYNWGGEWPNRERYTLWKDVPNGDHKKRKGTRVTLPTPRGDAYFLWTQAAMRCLTYLERQPEVNPGKIGAFGISMGGTIMWNLAFDPRIKAGCAVYGAGWNTYTHEDPSYAIGHSGKTPSANDLRWRASLAPEASAPYVRFPMLFLSSSNDRHGYMDRAEDSLKLIPEGVPRAWALTPRFRHHIGADFIHDLPGWMDVHLKGEGVWPANPDAHMVKGEGGVPVFSLTPDRPKDVVKVEVFYALENPFAVNRHWRNGQVRESGGVYSAGTPVMNAEEYLFAFANITYQSGIVITSPLQAVMPSGIGAVASIIEPSRLFYDGVEGLAGWTHNSTGTDPIPARAQKRLMTATGPEGKPCFTVDRVSPMTYAPGDPEFRAPRGASLQFDIKTDKGEDFAAKLHRNYWVADFKTYSCDVHLEADPGWQTVTLTGAQFVNEKTDGPLGESINEVGVLELAVPKRQGWNDPSVMFRNFRWVGGEYVPHVHAYRGKKPNPGAAVTNSDDADRLHESIR